MPLCSFLRSTPVRAATLCTACIALVALTSGPGAARAADIPLLEHGIVRGPGVTGVKLLSDYHPPLRGTAGDTLIYFLDSVTPGGTFFIKAGAHPNEHANIAAAATLIETARPLIGRLIVIPYGNRAGLQPGKTITFQSTLGERTFASGGRTTGATHQAAHADKEYASPSGAVLSATDSRNLNRVYPGRADGTLTEQIAFGIMEVIRREEPGLMIDLHEGWTGVGWNVYSVERLAPFARKAVDELNAFGILMGLRSRSVDGDLAGTATSAWPRETGRWGFLIETLFLEPTLPMEQRAGIQLASLIALLRQYNAHHPHAPVHFTGTPVEDWVTPELLNPHPFPEYGPPWPRPTEGTIDVSGITLEQMPAGPSITDRQGRPEEASVNESLSRLRVPEDSVIPADRLVDWQPGARIPRVPDQATITAGELSSAADPAVVIQAVIDRVSVPGAVLLPPGTYLLRNILTIPSGVVLRGAGSDRTLLKFDLSEIPSLPGNSGTIQFVGKMDPTLIRLTKPAVAGSTTLSLPPGHPVRAGDTVVVRRENDAALMYTREQWKQSWAERAVGQIVRVVAVTGNDATIDVPLRLDYPEELAPTINVLSPVRDAGVENLALERLDDAHKNSAIYIVHADDCWVRDVTSANALWSHVMVMRSGRVTVADSYFHHAPSYGGGGRGYGVTLTLQTSDSHVTNNIFHDLRHSMPLSLGANGNVLSYNFSFNARSDERWPPADVSIHGFYSYMNLIEGNDVDMIAYADFWGPTGPLTTSFRNRVRQKISVNDASHRSNVVGNVVPAPYTRETVHEGTSYTWHYGYIHVTEDSLDVLVDANRIGDTLAGNPAGRPLPASLYLAEKPYFWGDRPWPGIGADVDADANRMRLPAEDRYLAHRSGTAGSALRDGPRHAGGARP